MQDPLQINQIELVQLIKIMHQELVHKEHIQKKSSLQENMLVIYMQK